MKKYFLILTILFLAFASHAQWTLKLSSNVELRTWKLTSKADKEEKGLVGASIVLTQAGGKVISQTKSEPNGNFTVLVPPNGDFILTVSYPGCNSKKFSIDTKDVPEDVAAENFKPSFGIGGFIMAKPFPGIDYSGLQQTLVKVEYKSNGKKFDKNDDVTDNGLEIVSRIADAEDVLINNFCSTNKAGDVALVKPDCPLARTLYEKAMTIIPGEQYPIDQLVKVGLCLKDKEAAEKKAAEDANAKAATDLAAKEKANQDALEKKALKENTEKKAVAANKAKEDEAKLAKAASEKANKEKVAEKPKEPPVVKKVESSNKIPPSSKVIPKAPENKGLAPSSGKTSSEETTTKTKKGNSDHSIPQVLGLNKYTESIKTGDSYFKMKRYREAKVAYGDALKEKPNDPYATAKLNDIEKLAAPK